MGRAPRPRPDPEGRLCYHALNRGNNRQDVLRDDGDRRAFLDALAKAKDRYPFDLLGYCLMTNHFHLVLRPGPGESISRILQSVSVAHTWRHHKRHRSSGHVWQGRFKAPPIEGGEHLLTVLRYVEANPSRAGMIADAADYPWSSHPARVLGRPDPLLDEFPEWLDLGDDEPARRAAWRLKVADPFRVEDLATMRASAATGRPLGTPAWVASTAERLGIDPGPARPKGRPRKVIEN